MSSKTPIYRRVKRYNEPGHAHFLSYSTYRRLPLLTNEVWRRWLGESVRRACNELRFALWGWWHWLETLIKVSVRDLVPLAAVFCSQCGALEFSHQFGHALKHEYGPRASSKTSRDV